MTQEEFVELLTDQAAPCFVAFDVYQDMASGWEDGVHRIAKQAGRMVKTVRDPIEKRDGFIFYIERDF